MSTSSWVLSLLWCLTHSKIFYFSINEEWINTLKMYNFAKVSSKVQNNRIPRIKYFCVWIPTCGSWHIFLGLKNRQIAIIAIFSGTKTHDTKNSQDFKYLILIHLTVLKNISKFKINRSTKMWTSDKQTDDDANKCST